MVDAAVGASFPVDGSVTILEQAAGSLFPCGLSSVQCVWRYMLIQPWRRLQALRRCLWLRASSSPVCSDLDVRRSGPWLTGV